MVNGANPVRLEASMSAVSNSVKKLGWRTPLVILLCGCLVSALSFGPRSTLGLFLTPMSQANGWGRDGDRTWCVDDTHDGEHRPR